MDLTSEQTGGQKRVLYSKLREMVDFEKQIQQKVRSFFARNSFLPRETIRFIFGVILT